MKTASSIPNISGLIDNPEADVGKVVVIIAM
jgi:hypothetical protein